MKGVCLTYIFRCQKVHLYVVVHQYTAHFRTLASCSIVPNLPFTISCDGVVHSLSTCHWTRGRDVVRPVIFVVISGFVFSQQYCHMLLGYARTGYGNPWWRHQMETFSALLGLCVGNSPVTAELPSQKPVTRSFVVLFGLPLNRRLSKQWRSRWFETPSRPLWRHCNAPTESIRPGIYLPRRQLHYTDQRWGYWPNFLLSFFPIIIEITKIPFACFISSSYLTGVTTAELWWRLSNMNVIWTESNTYACTIKPTKYNVSL